MTSASVSNGRGFSAIGLLLLIMIISIAAGTVATLLHPSQEAGALKVTNDRIAQLQLSITQYQLSHGGTGGSYPPSLSSLVTSDGTACAANNNPLTPLIYQTVQGWCGPYAQSAFSQFPDEFQTDGWGILFSYNAATGLITSCGPDRVCGDGDDIVFNP